MKQGRFKRGIIWRTYVESLRIPDKGPLGLDVVFQTYVYLKPQVVKNVVGSITVTIVIRLKLKP